ncbi:hypothetical protein COT77_01415 [Candidatus Berkelbacteria bacterium CG10_big_fil_rev_8_21_14_0_10_41_12]|uniref:Phosphomannomutase n=1 Tax=Candidatus Berkelbacteria bacterium CG10_big_fil_rev_8_21_14_0_10_41_12 TaxID=1974513 RepID=A0A2M6WXA9_9BACT|nr:MAG: hypothetical protein COT77_01415 [Candidatus Berkelbacteria bacterium CG10_big_fil_rev_8_21_14_0_10_41_12]
MIDEKIFKAYDIRGTYPDQVNEEIAARITCAYVEKLKPKTVVIGRDLREASEKMFESVVKSLVGRGINVKDAGEMTNPMMGFAVFSYGYDGGIILSASHNPIGYGGMKMFTKNAVTIPGNDEEIKKFTLEGCPKYEGPQGEIEKIDIFGDYIKFVRETIDLSKLVKQKILFDPCYGSVGLILDKLLQNLPVERIDLHTKPDKTFGGLSEPNPLNPEIYKEALGLAKNKKPDFGVLWDGDGDRIFFIDENGKFINAPYITAVLVEAVSKKHPNAAVVSDVRIRWPIERACEKSGMKYNEAKSGYRFIKEGMMEKDGAFGAEMTAHYFFKETKYMDNGLIPLLMIWELISATGKKLSELVAPYQKDHFMMDEVKFTIENPGPIIVKLKKEYSDYQINELDGLTIESPEFRFNFRASNTEPAAKLNMEAKSSEILEQEKSKLLSIIG